MWDVRAIEEQDDDFRNKSAVTRDACATVGWHYEVFSGLGEIERLNLLWLHGRRRPTWAGRYEEKIRRVASYFALETHGDEISGYIRAFLDKVNSAPAS